MARSTRTSNPVTLFPFLAVLLCTIGALVLMLVVVSAGIRKDAVATAKKKSEAVAVAKSEKARKSVISEPAETEPAFEEPVAVGQELTPDQRPIDPLLAKEPLPSPIKIAPARTLAEISDLENKARRLNAEVAARAKRLQSVNVKTYALQKQLRTVKAQQEDLQLAIVRTANQRAKLEESTGELRVENQQIIEWLDESRKLIDEHKDQLISPVHSIVPYDGQTGTVRRPIVIECADDVVRFEAEQVEIPISILQKFSPDQNPLASGVEALFRYWMAKARVEDPRGQPRKPYALILVRPSGAEAFSTAVFALDQMVGDFGYELVETGFQYEIPETTADAVRECRAAVEAEIRRGPIRSRHVLNPDGPLDITRVARGPAASRGFFSSSDFRNRTTGGTIGEGESGDDPSGSGAIGQGAGVEDSVAEAVARREADAKAATERARQLLSGRGAEASSLLSKGLPAEFDEARAAVLAEAARGEAELKGEREAAGLSGLSESFKGDLAARNRSKGEVGNPFAERGSNDRQGGPAFRDRSSNPGDDTGFADGRPRWLGSAADRPAVGNGEVSTQTQSTVKGGNGSGTGNRQSERGSGSAPNRDRSLGGIADGGSGRGPGAGDAAGDAAGQSSDMLTTPGNASAGQASPGQLAGRRSESDGQEIGSIVNRPAQSSVGSSSSASSSGGDSSPAVAAGGPVIPTRPRANRIPSLKAQRRWGRSHPNASLGLEKVVEVRIESSRIVVGNRFQVTRTPERSEADIVKLTIQTIEHLANQWGLPPPRFYWVPSVSLVSDSSEERLAAILSAALEDAEAALE